MDALTAIATRKSIRSYASTPLPEDILRTILGAASSAPVALGDYSNVHMTVVRNAGLLKQLGGEKPFYGATTLVMISAKESPYPSIEHSNAACMIQTMCIAATALSIGSVYISGASEAAKEDRAALALLALPEGYTPIAAVALGYPKEALRVTTAFKNSTGISYV